MNERDKITPDLLEAKSDLLDRGDVILPAVGSIFEDALLVASNGRPGTVDIRVNFRPHQEQSTDVVTEEESPLDTNHVLNEPSPKSGRGFVNTLDKAAEFVGGSVIDAIISSKDLIAPGLNRSRGWRAATGAGVGLAAIAGTAVVAPAPAVAEERVIILDESGSIVQEESTGYGGQKFEEEPKIIAHFGNNERDSKSDTTKDDNKPIEKNRTSQAPVVEEAAPVEVTSGGDTSVRGAEVSIVSSDSQSNESDDNGESIKVIFESTDESQNKKATETSSRSAVQSPDEQTQNPVETIIEPSADTATEAVEEIVTQESDNTPELDASIAETEEELSTDISPEPVQELAEDESTEEVISAVSVEEPTVDEPKQTSEASTEEIVVIVKKGDTLSELIEGTGEEINDVAKRSGIADPNKIYPGDEVLISKPTHVVVQKGQTLWEIARANNTTAKELGKLNDIFDINVVLVGQTIWLPDAMEKIVVEEGQTLGALSIEYEASVEKIVEINDIKNEDVILAGQDLIIPTDQITETSEAVESNSAPTETVTEPEVVADEELEVEPNTINPDTYKPPAGLSEAETIDWFDKHINVSVYGLNNFSFDTSRQGVFEDETPHVDMPDIKGFLIHWTGSHYENGIDQFIGAIANREGNCCNVQFTIDDRAEPVVYMHALDHDDKMIHARNFNDHAPGVEIFATGLEDYSYKQLEQAIYTAFHSLNANGIEIQPGVLFAHSEVTPGKIDPPPELVDRMEEHLIRLNDEYKAASEEDTKTEPVEEPEVVEETPVVSEPAERSAPVKVPDEIEEETAPVEVEATAYVAELAPAVIYEAQSTQSLINIGFSSLDIIPDEDKAKFDEVIGSIPTIQHSIENHNSREGDDWGPKIPATAALAIFHDLGLEGQDLLDAVTIVSGESGLSPFVIGDDKGERHNGLVTRMAVGLAQFFEYDEDGFDGGELAEKQVLLHPAVAMKQMVEWMERRGKKPWNFYNNRDEEGAWGGHYQRVVDAAQTIGFNDRH